MKKVYNILLFGAGSIGALKPDDIDNMKTASLTHAHAIIKNKQLRLVGVIDKDPVKLEKVKKKWKVPVFKSYVDFIKATRENAGSIPDIITVATSTESHAKIARDIAYKNAFLGCKYIFEKPTGSGIKDCNSILYSICNSSLLAENVFVHYNRMYSKTIRSVAFDVKNGNYGKIHSARLVYTRGIIRDACHGINLFNLFFGDFISGKILSNNHTAIEDYDRNDLTHAVYLSYDKCKHVFLMPCDGRDYSVFDFEIFTEWGRIVFGDHGKTFKFFPKVPEPIYGKFNSIASYPAITKYCGLENSLDELYKDVIRCTNTGGIPICSIDDAFRVHNVIHHLFEGYENK